MTPVVIMIKENSLRQGDIGKNLVMHSNASYFSFLKAITSRGFHLKSAPTKPRSFGKTTQWRHCYWQDAVHSELTSTMSAVNVKQ